jgi:hypothetical protein
MNKELNHAILTGLMRYGLVKNIAETMAIRTLAEQPDEWKRIAGRCKRGEVSKVHLFVVHLSESQWRTFVYAPGKIDNSEHVKAMLSQGPDTGSGPNEPHDAEPTFGYHRVASFDIGREVCAAVQVAA